MIKNKRILISGGAGFIGSNLYEKLGADNQIIIIDNFNEYYHGKDQNIEEVASYLNNRNNLEMIRGNLLDTAILDNIQGDVDIIFHLAAQAGVRYSIKNSSEVTNNNIISTLNLLEFGVKNNVQKFIFASSSSVYGNPIYTPVDEDHPKNPISPYAVSKLCCEFYADYYFRERGLNTTSLRFYTVYGPRGRPDMAIRKFFEKMMKNEEILIYGDGEQLRDFTYVSDIVNGLILAAENSKSNGQVFNLGYSEPVKVNELLDKMYKITKKARKLKYVEKQIGDVDVTHSNTEKAKNLLNYVPNVHIDEGLKKTFQWELKSMNIQN